MNAQDVILGLLSEQPRTGYEIKRHFEQFFSFFFDASYGTIYPTLIKMEKAELITKEAVRQEGKPDKNVYTITPAGRQRFERYLHAPAAKEVLRSDFLMHLYFGQTAGEEAVKDLLLGEIEAKRGLYEDLQRKLERLEEGKALTRYQKMSIQIGLAQYRATIDHLNELLKEEFGS
ncbi:helix-turn-helix transcriptional regulator [Saccharibacillus sp. CPCC 101409]|uniref:PadR family transcriptional regulator n=1 Tax=Saccharibacillus sp. CPCC 101409 TaxID=3058041 RepID=UPI0026724B56|nr:helix-turn-helix transcriptional regulator [Saccharibacillus sp. CPCC 101409]MDO3412196.1 helix-turn-helix transcriptional regulator [Saccharibacillus sp. CPCC 101409]